MIEIVVGFDQREAIAYHTFCQSIISRSSVPISFIPLFNKNFEGYELGRRDGSNNFIYSRFLTPWIKNYKGWAIFADGDMVCQDDIKKLWDLRDSTKAIQVVKHEYKTKYKKKYLSNINEDYPRKNWSSLILWNCEHPKNSILTPNVVSNSTGAYLHRFKWLNDDDIGELPLEWNWLVSEYENNEKEAKILHFTIGTPCFDEFRYTESSNKWKSEFNKVIDGMDYINKIQD
jgi:lipopolysaccharide biosynthesis glycosyltransferase